MYEIYKINELDTLKDVLDRYNTTEEELIKINGNEIINTIKPNKEIIVPKKNNNKFNYYTVKKEDNIYQIAKTHNIDYNMLLKINGLEKDDYIYPNQTILIPKENTLMYLTKQGDTITTILNNFNTNINKLLDENDKIYLSPEQIIFF